MEELGEDMVTYCAGLPLAIIIVEGILATKYPSLTEWLKVSVNVKSYFKNDKGQVLKDVLLLSYDDLPPYLRPCFLYLSQFPEDYEIPVDRLIQLWIAKGIVSSKQEEGDEGQIAEDVAEGYLMELAERCMIQLSRIGRVRRVSVHKYFWIHYIKNPRLRSLLFFDEFLSVEEEDKVLPLAMIRVLHYERGVAGCKLPNDIGKLIRIRFLRLRGLDFMSSKLQSSLGNLRCLQSLDLRIENGVWSNSVHVPDVLWRVQQLRHLYLPKQCSPTIKLKLGTLRSLQTFVNFNTKSCYIKDLINMTNIRELEIRGPFNIEDFNIEELELKLANM
ncbi:hypothetical protein GOBAR_AA29357 [Gossypium barbadense]|uniref:Uncharacterized protein n=1 Tax=Gossypium barbadense TaxID=3634 RepID=A0A2P5WJU9_GOSBA|nr:hypothetical protein GOBAR_AA29357 [Gossypium barbadense]